MWACTIPSPFRYISGPRDLAFPKPASRTCKHQASSLAPISSPFPGLTRLLVCSLVTQRCQGWLFCGVWLWTEFGLHARVPHSCMWGVTCPQWSQGWKETGTGIRLGWGVGGGNICALAPGSTNTRTRPVVRIILQVFRKIYIFQALTQNSPMPQLKYFNFLIHVVCFIS